MSQGRDTDPATAMSERLGNNPGPIHREGLPLTDRQREIMDGYAKGERSHEIIRRLGISRKTLEGHQANAKSRLGARTVMQAVALYARGAA